MRRTIVAALALVSTALAQAPLEARPQQVQEDVVATVESRAAEARKLRDRATELTVKVGELAASGKLPQDEEALAQMRRMVDELTEIRARLVAIEKEVEEIKAFVTGAKKSLPITEKAVTDLQRTKWGNYVQFQYRDTNQMGGQTDAFSMRRIRLGLTQRLNPQTSMKVSFDLAQNANGLSNNTAAQLRDAILTYSPTPGLRVATGQFPMPVGYEIERSSTEREFPERAVYNLENFPGERTRGVNLSYSLSPQVTASFGALNALTMNDPEQRSVTGSPANRLGVVAGLRVKGSNFEGGLSGFATERPGYQVGYLAGAPAERVYGPSVDRQFLYLDGLYTGLLGGRLFVRGEAMVGKDRSPLPLPAVSTSSGESNAGQVDREEVEEAFRQKDRAGYQLMVGYNFNTRNQLALRYETYDPDLDMAGDFVRGYGLAYNHFLNPNTRLTLAHEIYEDDRRGMFLTNEDGPIRSVQQKRYNVTTLRVQFRF